ncbi:IclR family transcriptional regulator [Nocardioides sp. Soil796]|uniref:IclR family transcriptional regulator n=1 Tax=Nocardioides sp. Soil796 TaxID=1736412 RepID=UPI00070A8223|nr:IclR family transcriptional regulator [Nocardioides sp. Soil796]KRF14642.1 hypothetical protein ASH02_10060 [Nocardioides sp. Soil796]
MSVLQIEPTPTPRPGVAERLTWILDSFVDGPEVMFLEDITEATGLPRSTAFRLVTQLVDLGWLEHAVCGYRLGPRVLALSAQAQTHATLRSAASDTLNDLHEATGAVAHLGVLEGGRVHYLDKIGGPLRNSIPVTGVGKRIAADRGVSGRVLLAGLPPEQVDVLLAQENRTQRLPSLHQQLDAARRRHGIVQSPAENCPMHINAVAAPILSPAGAIGAIGVASRRHLRLDALAPQVARAARQISLAMFPGWTGRR